MIRAPVALFVYSRLDHTRRTVEALAANQFAAETSLFIFSDAAKRPEVESQVRAVRDYIATVQGFRSVTIVARERNFGLAASLVDGITQICAQYGRVIVLEDDLITSPCFLTFMNDALDFYAEDARVIAVHGYMFPVQGTLPETFFLRDPGCWGWGTWKRAWDLFDGDGEKHLAAVREQGREREFNLDGSYNYLGMLKERVTGKNQSWAILWYATAFFLGKLTLHPGRSLVHNIGFDGSGTHGGTASEFAVTLAAHPVQVASIPVEEDLRVRAALVSFLKKAVRPRSLRSRITGRIRRLFTSSGGAK